MLCAGFISIKIHTVRLRMSSTRYQSKVPLLDNVEAAALQDHSVVWPPHPCSPFQQAPAAISAVGRDEGIVVDVLQPSLPQPVEVLGVGGAHTWVAVGLRGSRHEMALGQRCRCEGPKRCRCRRDEGALSEPCIGNMPITHCSIQ